MFDFSIFPFLGESLFQFLRFSTSRGILRRTVPSRRGTVEDRRGTVEDRRGTVAKPSRNRRGPSRTVEEPSRNRWGPSRKRRGASRNRTWHFKAQKHAISPDVARNVRIWLVRARNAILAFSAPRCPAPWFEKGGGLGRFGGPFPILDRCSATVPSTQTKNEGRRKRKVQQDTKALKPLKRWKG